MILQNCEMSVSSFLSTMAARDRVVRSEQRCRRVHVLYV